MALTPDYSKLVKPQTFSSVAKNIVHTVLRLDADYPAGGYLVDSKLLFNEEGFKFCMVGGYSLDAPSQYFRMIAFNQETSKIQIINPDTNLEHAAGDDLAGSSIYCDFIIW
jgi:hypothetical protein